MNNTLFILILIIFASCSTQQVLKTDSQNDIDLSGRWNDTDAEIATSELFNNLITSSWLKNHQDQYDLNPRIEIMKFESNFKNGGGSLEKYFSQYLNANTAIELIKNKDQKSAEFNLTGSINAEEFATEDQNHIDYVLRAQLKDLNGKILWEDNSVVKKYIKD
ncbi:hypothetical protein [Marivirga sp.]|uniref:hypothetical protein n=1 Tax=Marivirga sp. TaxID=2018662 RepID=UPI003DA7331C